ncbi:MAG: thioredoxin family protein [Candidatus Moeniiplasma glomeromycotorum]|nr:thioredoxin family protein [Candidatus Moeniiplasma glomeromycotorum]MCE8167482.1 thioredoxin family protein [Candidatus Moeniiplasma glomeromycotorum]MCE8168504.1 thioredoxin family protein [Candidatus Moeniiplasma glomeromycotorum]
MKLQSEREFDLFLQQNRDKLTLVKFFAEWCPPCHELQKNLNQLEKEIPGLVTLEVDVEKFPQLAQRLEFQVGSLPTLFLFRPTSIGVEKKVGLQSLSQLKEWVKN